MVQTRLTDQKILITGGAGFVGVHVARELAAQGAELVLLDAQMKRRSFLNPLLASGRASFVQSDLSSDPIAELDESEKPIDLILYLSLKVPAFSGATLDDYLEANLTPLKRLLKDCPGSVRGICLASSAQVYGSGAAVPIPEGSTIAPATRYGLMKREMEYALLEFGERERVPVTVLRYSTIYGPGEPHSPRAIPSFIRNLLSDRPPVIYGDGRDVNDYLFVDDAATGTGLALEQIEASAGIYNIGSGRGYSTRHISRTVQELTDIAVEPVHEPARNPRRYVVIDIARAHDRLGFNPQTGIEVGIATEIEYERSRVDRELTEVSA